MAGAAASGGAISRAERFGPPLLAALLVAVGATAWWFQLRPALDVDTSRLEHVPAEIGAWHSQDIPVQDDIQAILRADYNLSRVYLHPFGELVWLYVGYYGTERGGRPEHLPATCYQAQGWTIEQRRRIDVGEGRSVNEFLLQKDGEWRLVHFWFRTHQKTGIATGIGLSAHHLWMRLTGDRTDGSLVRISTPVESADAVLERSRLMSFRGLVEPLLGEHWPTERARPG